MREIVHAAQVDPTYYSFEGQRHDALCLLAEGQTWHVFLSERGDRFDERTFASEDEACIYFYRKSSVPTLAASMTDEVDVQRFR